MQIRLCKNLVDCSVQLRSHILLLQVVVTVFWLFLLSMTDDVVVA